MPTPHNFVFPTDYDMNSVLPMFCYSTKQYFPKSISEIVSALTNLGASFNALLIRPNYNGTTYGYTQVYPITINADNEGKLYIANYEYLNNYQTDYGIIASANNSSERYYHYDLNSSGNFYNTGYNSYFTTYNGHDGRTYRGFSGEYDSNEQVMYKCILVIPNNSSTVIYNGDDVTPISYTWQPFQQLVGNNNQFRLNLSQIKQQYIGDGVTTVTTQDNDKFIIEPLTSLRRISGNFALDEERVIAWCGDNYATLTKHITGDYLGIRIKLYFDPSIPAVYDTGYKYFYDPLDDYYLSFIYDRTHQAAMVNLIHYYEANGSYWWGYNESVLPSREDLLDIYVWLDHNGEVSDAPYDTGTTDDGGDQGTPRPQDHIYTSPLPTKSGLGLGLIGLYHPTAEQLEDIANLLWSSTLIDNVLKYFSNFADNILCLYVLPFLPANLPQTHFTVGHYATEIDNVDYVTTRFYDIDMGSVQLDTLWDSYLDYEPYSRCQIYLPYIGMKDLDMDELMCPTDINGMMPKASGCTLSLLYRLDILTGAIVAQLKISNEYLTDEIRYQFSGKVGYNIPLTGETYSGIISSLLSVATAGASALMTGGLTAPLVDGAAIAGTIQAQKGSVTHSGNLSGDVSMMSQKTPYIEISSPNKPLLDLQENFTGFPSYKSDKLDNFSGYTEVIEVHAEGFVCTETERSEIIRLLKEGVIL